MHAGSVGARRSGRGPSDAQTASGPPLCCELRMWDDEHSSEQIPCASAPASTGNTHPGSKPSSTRDVTSGQALCRGQARRHGQARRRAGDAPRAPILRGHLPVAAGACHRCTYRDCAQDDSRCAKGQLGSTRRNAAWRDRARLACATPLLERVCEAGRRALSEERQFGEP